MTTAIRMQEGGVQEAEVQDERGETITTVVNGGEEAQNETGRTIMTGTAIAEGIEVEIAIAMTMVTTSGASEPKHTMENYISRSGILASPGKQRRSED